MDNCNWRSDLDRIEVINESQFIEYTKDGESTLFTTTVFNPFKRWEFDMENSNMKGHWIGVFSEDNDRTCIEFTEIVTVKKLIMRPFVKRYLKGQQKKYVSDLEKALNSIDYRLLGGFRKNG